MNQPLDHPQSQETRLYRFKRSAVIVLTLLTALSYLLKEMDVPGFVFFSLIFSVILTSYSMVSFLILKGTDMINNVYFALSLLWLLFVIWGASSNGGHPYNWAGVRIIFLILALITAAGLAFYRYKKNNTK